MIGEFDTTGNEGGRWEMHVFGEVGKCDGNDGDMSLKMTSSFFPIESSWSSLLVFLFLNKYFVLTTYRGRVDNMCSNGLGS